jgi:replicative DNA helicase
MNHVSQLSDPQSERALLAACLLDPRAIDRAASRIVGSDFFDPDYGQCFTALTLLRDGGKPTGDPPILLARLKDMGVSQEIANPVFLTRLLSEGGIVGHETYYADQIKKLSQLRRQQQLARELLNRAGDPMNDPADNAEWMSAQLDSLASEQASSAITIHAAGVNAIEQIEAAAKRKGQRGVLTGLQHMDECHGGWMPGNLIILAARPGVGKTAMAEQIAIHNALRGKRVLYVTLEMTKEELALRALCPEADVDGRRVRTGDVDEMERQALRDGLRYLQDLGIVIWDRPITLAGIRGLARYERAIKPLDFIVVDYIGLVTPDDQRAPRHEQIGRISRGLKILAKEIDVPVLALAQLNREAETKQPTLANLRDSGSLEQDADIVWMLHEPNGDRGGVVELLQVKNRHGDRDTVELRFTGKGTRFKEAEPTPDASLMNWPETSQGSAQHNGAAYRSPV